MRIRTKTRSEKAARTRKRNTNPLLAAKKLAERPQPAKPDWETLRPLILKKTYGVYGKFCACYLCGKPLTLAEMTTDHMVIQPMGCKKNDDFDNLMPCCAECNSDKGSRRLAGPCDICRQPYTVKGLDCLRCMRQFRRDGFKVWDEDNKEVRLVRTERTGRFTL